MRKIFNKESRPETQGLKGFMDRLSYVKKGVPIPEKLVWNGIADSGQVVPDGNYTATIEAVNDNGIHGSVGPFPVVVDNTPPKVEINVPLDPPIFGPDGVSSKQTILIKLSGSVEDLWSAQVMDAAGKAVRTLKYENSAPADWTWDGKGDDGKVVPDGVYSFSISSTDRAGNSVRSWRTTSKPTAACAFPRLCSRTWALTAFRRVSRRDAACRVSRSARNGVKEDGDCRSLCFCRLRLD